MAYTIPTKKAGDFELPVLGLGTWNVGGGYTPDTSGDETNIAAIKEAIELGITHIDTAEMYADGHTEELVGKAIKDFDRSKLFITTKVWWTNLAYDDVIAACKRSLSRLGLKQIDLYLIHGPNPNIAISETMQAMGYLIENGLTRFIGVSNFDAKEVAQAQAASKYKIVNNQFHYNLSARDYETNGTLDFCRKNNVLVTAYRPLGFGMSAGKKMEGGIEKQEMLLLEGLGKKYNKTPGQIALNWLMGEPGIVTVFKSINVDHIKENLGSLGWELEKNDREILTNDFSPGFTKNVGVHPDIPSDPKSQ